MSSFFLPLYNSICARDFSSCSFLRVCFLKDLSSLSIEKVSPREVSKKSGNLHNLLLLLIQGLALSQKNHFETQILAS